MLAKPSSDAGGMQIEAPAVLTHFLDRYPAIKSTFQLCEDNFAREAAHVQDLYAQAAQIGLFSGYTDPQYITAVNEAMMAESKAVGNLLYSLRQCLYVPVLTIPEEKVDWVASLYIAFDILIDQYLGRPSA